MERSNENVIEWIDGDTEASVTLSSRYKGKLMRLKQKCPDEVRIIAENADGSVYGKVPLSYVKILKPRFVSEEQRQAAREKAVAMGFGKKTDSETC